MLLPHEQQEQQEKEKKLRETIEYKYSADYKKYKDNFFITVTGNTGELIFEQPVIIRGKKTTRRLEGSFEYKTNAKGENYWYCSRDWLD